jgi:transposase
MNLRYCVVLSQSEREELTALLSGGQHPARKLKRAQILLAADAGISDEAMVATVAVSGSTIYRTKRRFVEGNLDAALSEEPRAGAERKLSGQKEALLIATACSTPPEGFARWTLELLAEKMVRLTEHEGQHPEKRWITEKTAAQRNDRSYALITRIIDPDRKRVQMAIGGINEFGTQSACEFLTDGAALSELSHIAPRGWQEHNLQILLEIDMSGAVVANPRMLGIQVW